MKKSQTLGIIPARYGSVRFPGKPLIPILGKSLIQRTYENALKCEDLQKVIVATDDKRIFDHIKNFGGEVVMTSTNCQTGTDRIHDVLKNYPQYKEFSQIVNIQGDEPCVDPNILSLLIQLLDEDKTAVMATPITRLLHAEDAFNPSIVKCVKDFHHNALYFSRALIPNSKTQNFNPNYTYYRHIGIYAYQTDFLPIYSELPPSPLHIEEDLEQLKVLENGYRIKVAVVEYNGFDVNEPKDIEKVEGYLCRQNLSS